MLRLKDIREHPSIKDEDEYRKKLKKLQFRLLTLQQTMYAKQRRAVIVFEGWDAAGKGGAIRRLTEKLDPRGFKVYPIAAPHPEEQRRHFLYRFWQKVPTPGELVIFDRSWYGRVLVERVERFCDREDWERAYAEINAFEKLFTDEDCPVIKIFLHITKKEQLRRFEERRNNPYKRWKIGPDDWRNRKRWKDYEKAIDGMLARCHVRDAPWSLVAANRKWHARTEVLNIVTRALDAWW